MGDRTKEKGEGGKRSGEEGVAGEEEKGSRRERKE